MRRIAIAWTIVVGACGPPHVELRAPTAMAPFPDRFRAFQDLRPRASETTTNWLKGGEVKEELVLADGARLQAIEDLTPLVSPGSETYRAANDSASERTSATLALVLLGGSIAIGGYLIEQGVQRSSNGMIIGGGIVAGIGLPVGAVWGLLSSKHSKRDRERAIRSYEHDLGEHLGVCSSPAGLAECAPR
jgi:hypothetical protein